MRQWGSAMPRPVWSGVISFGLLNIPVSLYSGERRVDIHFRMLDSRDSAPVRYERVNAETGEEVPWKEIVKGFEYAKNSYIVIDEEELKQAAPRGGEAVEIEGFIDQAEIKPHYYEKPYYLVPGKKAEKGYVLLREVLKRTGRVGLGRVVIRTREYLSIVMPLGDALVLNLLRYPQEVVDTEEFNFPDKALEDYRISDRELQMAEDLLESMVVPWQPENYEDKHRQRLQALVDRRLAEEGGAAVAEEPAELPSNAATNVVDFRKILQDSLRGKGGGGKGGGAKGGGEKGGGKKGDNTANEAAPSRKKTASRATRKAPAKSTSSKRKAADKGEAAKTPRKSSKSA